LFFHFTVIVVVVCINELSNFYRPGTKLTLLQKQ
jgi:hypothetical protein